MSDIEPNLKEFALSIYRVNLPERKLFLIREDMFGPLQEPSLNSIFQPTIGSGDFSPLTRGL